MPVIAIAWIVGGGFLALQHRAIAQKEIQRQNSVRVRFGQPALGPQERSRIEGVVMWAGLGVALLGCLAVLISGR